MVYASIDLNGELIATAPTKIMMSKVMGVSIDTINSRELRKVNKNDKFNNLKYMFNIKKINDIVQEVIEPKYLFGE